jgi:hypothetical protein
MERQVSRGAAEKTESMTKNRVIPTTQDLFAATTFPQARRRGRRVRFGNRKQFATDGNVCASVAGPNRGGFGGKDIPVCLFLTVC